MINCNFSVIRTYIRLWWSTISWQLNCSRGFSPKVWRRQAEIDLWTLKLADVHIQKVNTWLATFHNLHCKNHSSPLDISFSHKPAINSFLFPKVIYRSWNDSLQVDNSQSWRVCLARFSDAQVNKTTTKEFFAEILKEWREAWSCPDPTLEEIAVLYTKPHSPSGLQGLSELSEYSPRSLSKVWIVRGQSEDSPSVVRAVLPKQYFPFCSDFTRTLLVLYKDSVEMCPFSTCWGLCSDVIHHSKALFELSFKMWSIFRIWWHY